MNKNKKEIKMSVVIKSLKILGFKKFESFHIDFNDKLNIIIGENSCGKSTIIEAINVVINQRKFGQYGTVVQQDFNVNNVNDFFEKKDKTINDLPKIRIEVELSFSEEKDNLKFFGSNFDLFEGEEGRFGISFLYEFNKEDYSEIFNQIDFSNSKFLPLEYYHATWKTFGGHRYSSFVNPIKSITIDSSVNSNDIYGNYARQIFSNMFSEEEKKKLSYDFASSIDGLLKDREILSMEDGSEFHIDEHKSGLESLIEIRKNNISLRNMGKGQENIIKTSLSLNKKTDLDLVMIEEPENHLSYSNTRKQIEQIRNKSEEGQIILTTHESMILNRLNISKAIWITDNEGQSLKNLKDDDIKFFEKSDNFDILNFILGNKIILVEGSSEYILLPNIIKNIFDNSMDDLKINVISMRGIKYKHFIELSKIVNKKTLVITDNDDNEDKLKEIRQINKNHEHDNDFYIATDEDVKRWTLEYCIYDDNESICKNIVENKLHHTVKNSIVNKKDVNDINLATMLKNKSDFAIALSEEINKNFKVPEYIKRGLEWLVK